MSNVTDLPPEALEQARLIREFFDLAGSLWVSQSIYVAAELGLADALAEGPQQAAAVADVVDADPTALERLMRALVTLGLLSQTGDDSFELTPLGSLLRSDSRDSLRSSVRMTGRHGPRAWGELVNCVRTGHTAGKLLEDIDDPFQGGPEQPADQAVFNQAMAEGTRQIAAAVVLAYDFADIRTIVDVGGGYGALLPPILRAHPETTAVVFDLSRCREGAARVFEKTRIAERCEFVVGDFFEDPLPPGADVYVLKSVIHDWDDQRSLTILRNCRAAAAEGCRLLVIEVVVPDRIGTSQDDRMIVANDLNMLVSTGGRERTETEYRRLLDRASFAVTRIVPTLAGLSVIEAVPA
jgi:SAM-dependent methyltransferase